MNLEERETIKKKIIAIVHQSVLPVTAHKVAEELGLPVLTVQPLLYELVLEGILGYSRDGWRRVFFPKAELVVKSKGGYAVDKL